MGSGRPQKGMNRKNHHDNLSYSGQQRRSSGGGGTRAPKYTISDAIMGKKPPKSNISSSLFGSSKTSGGKKPYKSF